MEAAIDQRPAGRIDRADLIPLTLKLATWIVVLLSRRRLPPCVRLLAFLALRWLLGRREPAPQSQGMDPVG